MSINLASKYAKSISARFQKESYLAGNTCEDFDFAGVRSISIYTPLTVDLNDYDRTATANRFGTPVEMQDTIQEIELSQDKGFSITIDRGNNEDQMNVKGAAKMLKLQLKEKVVPFMDQYALKRFTHLAGTVAGIDAPTKSTIVSAILDGAAVLDNAMVPDADRILYIPTTYYNMLRQSSEFLAADIMAQKALEKGLVGMVADMRVIKVPDKYLPEGVYFLITHKSSVLAPNKIKTARVLTNVMGIDGNVLEGRNYFDAFVLASKCDGVYAAVAGDKVCAAPVITSAGAISSTTPGAVLYYTTDGTDPRYSKTVKTGSTSDVTQSGTVVKAYAKKDDMFPSGVTSMTL